MNAWPQGETPSAWMALGCTFALAVVMVLMAVGIVAVVRWVL